MPADRSPEGAEARADLLQGVSENPLLKWLPDETLFSMLSRLHRFWGRSASWQTTSLLFGHRRAGTHHDFPSALDQLVDRTAGKLGSAQELARDRTLLRYYRPFMPAQEVNAAVETMRGPSVAHLKFGLGLLTSRFRAHHPLKACISCMQRDVESDGWAYWHLQHQFPGVWVCRLHGEPLLSSTVKSTGVERFLWHLPIRGRLSQESSHLTTASLDALTKFAGLITDLVEPEAADGWLEAPVVQATLRRRLVENGWVTAGGNTRLKEAAGHYLEHCSRLRSFPELGSLPSDLDEAKTHLGPLIRPLRAGTHPLRLLVAIDWLFTDADEFVELHERTLHGAAAQTDAAVDTRPQSIRLNDPRKSQLLDLLSQGESATAAARVVGVDVATAMAWATAAGVVVRRRPKILTGDVRRPLVRDLRDGLDKVAAAERYGVSVETVTRVLRTEVGLQAAWTAARAATARQAARTVWLTLLAQHRSLGVKLMRASNPAAYAWLYRNDRSWLREHTPGKRAESSEPRASRVRWDERDEALSRAVRQAIVRLSSARPGKALRLWQIYQAVPELKPKLSALERLPLTRRALESGLARPKSSGSAGSLFD